MTQPAQSVSFSHKMSAKKPRQVRVYLNEEAAELLAQASGQISDISESQLTTMIVVAGLRALRDANFRMVLPFRMAIDDGVDVPVLPSSRRI